MKNHSEEFKKETLEAVKQAIAIICDQFYGKKPSELDIEVAVGRLYRIVWNLQN